MKEFCIRHKNLWLWLLILGFGIVYLSLCFNDNIWTDEGFTIQLLRECSTYGEACAFTAADVHPPLYYIYLKFFTDRLGIHLLLLKILSILPMLFTMALGAGIIQREFGFRTALFYILILGTLPCTMEYAIQVRMYSLALFLVTLCGLSAFRVVRYGKWTDWLGLVTGGVGAAYTHYFAFVAVLWIYGFLFLYFLIRTRKTLWKWILAAVVSLVAYLPWLAIMLGQVRSVSEDYWITQIDASTILGYFTWMAETELPYASAILAVLFAVALVLVFYQIIRRKKMEKKTAAAVLGLAVPVLVIATGVILSLLIRPVFVSRYVFPSLGLLCLFLAIAFSYLKPRTWVFMGLFWLALGTIDYQKNYYEEYQSTYTPQTEQFLKDHVGDNDLVVYNYPGYAYIYEYYIDKDKLVDIQDVNLDGDYDNLWFLDTPLNQEFTGEQLADNGLVMIPMGQYGIEDNEFKIYLITRE